MASLQQELLVGFMRVTRKKNNGGISIAFSRERASSRLAARCCRLPR
jgi:hypothetical protein